MLAELSLDGLTCDCREIWFVVPSFLASETMKRNPVKAALKAGKPQVGTWLSLGSMYATRVLARVGFPWLTVDMEHSPIGIEQAANLFGAIAEAGCVPLARVPRGTHENIKRRLDAGAWGVVIPMVNTVEEAKLAISPAQYPPRGNRSIGGGLHATEFDAPARGDFHPAHDTSLGGWASASAQRG